VAIANHKFNGIGSGTVTAKIEYLGNSVSASGKIAFSGFVAGVDAPPVLAGYEGMQSTNPRAFNLTIGQPFSIKPNSSTSGATIGQASWKAERLPKGLTINAVTGEISGKLNTGIVNASHSVEVTVTNSFGSASLNLKITIVDLANGLADVIHTAA
jgi:hypothetical protein